MNQGIGGITGKGEQRSRRRGSGRSLWRGLISVAILIASSSRSCWRPGLHGVADEVADMKLGWFSRSRVRDPVVRRIRDRLPAVFDAHRCGSAPASLSASWRSARPSRSGRRQHRGGACCWWSAVATDQVAERSAVLFLLTSAITW